MKYNTFVSCKEVFENKDWHIDCVKYDEESGKWFVHSNNPKIYEVAYFLITKSYLNRLKKKYGLEITEYDFRSWK